MCNKCESTAVEVTPLTPATPLLAHWVANREVAITYRTTRMREFMQNSFKANNSKYWTNARAHRTGEIKEQQKQGHLYAKLIATANKYATHDAGNSDDTHPIISYLVTLNHTSSRLMSKFEPMYYQARNNYHNGTWEELEVMNKLHPYVNNQGGDYVEYQNAQKAFHLLNNLHRIHISTEDINQIAYYPTLKHMREGREVRTRLGRYLTKYQQVFGLSDSDIKSMAEKHTTNMRSRGGWAVEFIAHNDKDGWLEVYHSDDVSSCMQGEDAVRIYAHEKSVLRLAYVKTSDGRIIARCIVRDDDSKGWLRVYPDPNGYAEGRFLLDYLKTNGYANQTNLDGVLLRHVETDSGIVCPYLDCGNNGDQSVGVVTRDGKTYLMAGGRDYSATNTDGYLETNRCSCDRCGDSADEDDLTHIDHDGYSVCEYCRDNNYTYAYGSRYEDWFPEDECVMVGSSWYWVDTIGNHDIYQCEHSEEYYHIDDMVSTYDGMYHIDYATSVDRHTDWEYVYEKNVHTLSDGTTCHEDDADKYEAEIAESLVEA